MALLVGWLAWPSGPEPADKDGTKPVGRISVESDPPGATVTHGEDVLGVTPVVVDSLTVGNRTLVLELAGHEADTLEVMVTAEPSTIRRTLRALPPPAQEP
jgi:hypothetical protein